MTNPTTNRPWAAATGVLTGLLLTVVSISAQAQTYDAVKDFSITANPNGVWSYGWSSSLGDTLSLYTVTDTTSVPGMEVWVISGTIYDPPQVADNDTAEKICYETLCVPPAYLLLHPGPLGQYSLVRWTAPASGAYELVGGFAGLDYAGPTTTDVHVLLNSTRSLLSGPITSYELPLFFKTIVNLKIGDTIDLAVGWGADKTYGYDSTGATLTITQFH